jgi:hypothetical protein
MGCHRIPGNGEASLMILDMHVHSSLSPCSRLHPLDILRSARSRGLDGVCITDHHSMEAQTMIREGVQADGLCVIIGQEYSTLEGDFLLFGSYEALPRGLDARGLLRHVRETGGAAVAAHPFRAGRGTASWVLESGSCLYAEGENGRNSVQENRTAREWLSRCGLAALAGSDAHRLRELGGVATRFEYPIRSRLELIHALKGQCRTCIAWHSNTRAASQRHCAPEKEAVAG